MHRTIIAVFAAALAAAPLTDASELAAQMLIDFGPNTRLTTAAARTWNNIDSAAMSTTTTLRDISGATNGATLTFLNGMVFHGGNTAGTTIATASSPLANLNYPTTAISDCLFGSDTFPTVEFELRGLDVNRTYDFTMVASRVGVADMRTTEYFVQGATAGRTTLDPSNNRSMIARITGIRPDANATIRFTMQAAPGNTNPNRYYYLNAMGIDFGNGNPPPPALLPPTALTMSRVFGRPVSTLNTTIATSDNSTPTVGLSLVDQATNQPPTWLAVPPQVTAGTPFSIGFGGTALPVGTHRATMTATAGGYPSATTTITLVVRPVGSLNLLYYGNSFTIGNGTVPDLTEFIVEDAGLPVPNTVTRLQGGRDLFFHLTDPYHAGAITNALTPGEEWDYVILQGHSTEATTRLGNPTAFLANAESILRNVRAHSPNARAIMFQTWARAQGHSFYQGSTPLFADPLTMHRQIETSYRQAVVNLDAAFGPDAARRAAAGEAAALLNFVPAIYANDLYHAGPPITLMTAMTIYSAIYGRPVSSLIPDFNGNSRLVQRLRSFGLTENDWRTYAGIADRVANPSIRAYPGSGEDTLLSTSVGGPLTSRPIKDLTAGNTFRVSMHSPIGTYDGNTAVILLSLFPTGSPPAPHPVFPELHVHPAGFTFVATTASLSGTLDWQIPISASLPGWSALFQGGVFAPSTNTGNPFTVTDAHEIRLR